MSKRSENWDNLEKKLLIKLVRQHIRIVSSKQQDCETNKKKCAAWTTISKEFNVRSKGPFRNQKKIKEQWKRMKRSSVQAIPAGTPHTALVADDQDTNGVISYLMNEIEKELVENDANPTPLDVIIKEEKDESINIEFSVDDGDGYEEFEIHEDDGKSHMISGDDTAECFEEPTIEEPTPKPHSPKPARRRKPHNGIDETLGLEFEREMIEMKREEHIRTMSNMEKEHEAQIKLINLEIEQKLALHKAQLKYMEEEAEQKRLEHEIRMNILEHGTNIQ